MAINSMFQQLPHPQYGKTGWPWTKGAKELPKTMPDGRDWPKISIVTPSYNQGQFIEETIRSVLSQNYPNLEYIIMDGGSSDNSVEIIKKYEPWLTYWVSEKDNGQADAIYRGFEKTSGEIIAWINSDDYYLPNAFKHVARIYAKESADFIGGGVYFINGNGRKTSQLRGYTQDFRSLLYIGEYIVQPSCFWSRNAFFEVGGFDRSLKFALDYDLFLRLSKRYNQKKVNKYIAVFREHYEAKSSTIWTEVGLKETQNLAQYHNVDYIDKKVKNKIINKEKFRLLYYQCKSINNVFLNPKLILAIIKRGIICVFDYIK